MKISRAKAVEHKCHQCMGEYADGLQDCEVVKCPLYAFMPYRKLEPVTDWKNHSARARGIRPPKTISDKRKQIIVDNFARRRAVESKIG